MVWLDFGWEIWELLPYISIFQTLFHLKIDDSLNFAQDHTWADTELVSKESKLLLEHQQNHSYVSSWLAPVDIQSMSSPPRSADNQNCPGTIIMTERQAWLDSRASFIRYMVRESISKLLDRLSADNKLSGTPRVHGFLVRDDQRSLEPDHLSGRPSLKLYDLSADAKVCVVRAGVSDLCAALILHHLGINIWHSRSIWPAWRENPNSLCLHQKARLLQYWNHEVPQYSTDRTVGID